MPSIEVVNNPSYPSIKDINVIELDFSDIQFKLYMAIRQNEKKEKSYGNIFQKSSSTYRSGTRLACNFVFSESGVCTMFGRGSGALWLGIALAVVGQIGLERK